MNEKNPPKYPLDFFRWFCRPEMVEDIEGDLVEKFNACVKLKGHGYAKRSFFIQILWLLRPGIVRPLFKNRKILTMSMFHHNFKIGWRILWRNKGFSAINIGGLALGMAVAMSIVLWITDELKYDRFHEGGDQIFKVMRHVHSGSQIQTSDRVTWNIANVLEENYSEIDHVAITSPGTEIIFRHDAESMREEGLYVTPTFLEIFSWPLVVGESEDQLSNPSSILISESMARRYFGDEPATDLIGRTVRHSITDVPDLTVSGVFADVPRQSSVQFDFLLPMQIFYDRNGWLTDWNNSGPNIYIKTKPQADWQFISDDMVDVQNQHIEGFRSDLFLHPYQSQHLYSSFRDGKLQGGRVQYVRIFGLVALMIILIACINFMNLSTARSAQRTKEIGVRKTIGAGKRSLIAQFVGESVLLTFISFILAIVIMILALPMLNSITQKELVLTELGFGTWGIFGTLGLFTALLASAYPAIYFSSLSLIRIFRGSSQKSFNRSFLRRGLVVFQFVMSYLLIVGTLTVYKQIRFIHEKDLGFDREHVILLPLEGSAREKYETYRSELLRMPGVEQVGAASESPLEIRSNTHQVNWSGKDPTSEISNRILAVDANFTQTLGMQILDGSPLQPQAPDASDKYLINESAVEIMGFENPIGERLSFWGGDGTIVGVVKDFHMASFYENIEPTILWLRPRNISDLFVRTKPGELSQAIESLEILHNQFNADRPFTYSFLDAEFNEKYRSEQSIASLSLGFTGLALFIACLGLFGLAIFAGQQRIKEISVRKVLGASVAQIVYLLSHGFLQLVFLAILVAAPIAYILSEEWLQNFTYRAVLDTSNFLIPTAIIFLLTMIIVGAYGVRVSAKNPIHALQSE